MPIWATLAVLAALSAFGITLGVRGRRIDGVEPGRRRHAVIKQFEIYHNCRARRDIDSHDEDPYIVWHEIFNREIEVLPAGSPAITFITDPEHEPAMREAAAAKFGVVTVVGGSAFPEGKLKVAQPPFGFCHDVFI